MAYTEQEYIFPGGVLPQKFIESIYTNDWSLRFLRFVEARIIQWGDALAVKVSAECQETIDWQLQEWENYKKPKETSL